MKFLTYTISILAALSFFSCAKIEEEVKKTFSETSRQMKEKSTEIISENVNRHFSETLKNLTHAEDVKFSEIFIASSLKSLDSVQGKSVILPTGSTIIVFKYTADKKALFNFLEKQPSDNDSQADVVTQKIDGQKLLVKLKFIEKFLPQELRDDPVFKTSENNKSLEFYRLNRSPVQNTLLYNPKNATFYHLAEVNSGK